MEECLRQFDRGYVKIDLDALEHNIDVMYDRVGRKSRLLLVIKTDGYGHGAVPIAQLSQKKESVGGFAVATFEEAKHLRECGITKPILILGYTFPYCYEELIGLEIRPAVFRKDTLRELSEAASRVGKTVKVHIKVDTGMSRIGIYPDQEGLSFIKMASELPGIEIEGIFTHFARADEKDKESAIAQYASFREFTRAAERLLGHPIPIRHCANSAAIIEKDLTMTHLDWVRAGITLYGLWPSSQVDHTSVDLEPVLSLHSRVAYVKDGRIGSGVSYGGTWQVKEPVRIATIPLGYGDGYPRSLSNCGYVLIRGQRAPILGRVCMDQFMVDVTRIPGVSCSDPVTLIGTDGKEHISMETLGELSHRFNYEFACDLGKRLPRVFYYRQKPAAYWEQFRPGIHSLESFFQNGTGV
ncbi:MAG: alanine racemase [Lachnospiraceae bacterium]|nr:alanine racemase [Lachnospiraceae bacterium]